MRCAPPFISRTAIWLRGCREALSRPVGKGDSQPQDLESPPFPDRATSADIAAALKKLRDAETTVLRQMTARKRSEAKLVESEYRLRTVIESEPECIKIVDARGRLVMMNRAGLAMIEADSPEQVVGKKVIDVIAPEYREVFAKMNERVIAGEPVRMEFEILGLKGARRWVETHAVPMRDEGRMVQLAITRDITERKRTDHAVQMSEHRARRQRSAVAKLAVDEAIASGDVPTAMRRLTEEAATAIQVERASVWLLSEERGTLRCIALFEAGPKKHTDGAVLKSADYPRYFEAIRAERQILADDAQADPRTSEFTTGYLVPLGIASMLDAGVQTDGRLAGVVCFEHVGEKRIWHSDEEAFATTIASLVAQILTTAERKQAQEALRESEKKFVTLFQAITDAVFVNGFDADGKLGTFLEVNDVACRRLGYSREELLRKSPQDIDAPESRLDARSPVVRKLKAGEEITLEQVHITKEGRRIPVEIHAQPFIFQERPALIAVVRDITERRQAQEALRESEEKFRTLFENAGDAIFLMRGDLFIDCNARTLEMFGCRAREQIVGHPPYEFSPPLQPNGRKSLEFAIEKITAALAGQPQFFEWMHTKLDGTPFPAEVSLNTVTLGNKVLLQAIVRDITVRKQAAEAIHTLNADLERRVRERTAALEAANKELESFSYSVSHDLRAPLRHIHGYAEMLTTATAGQLNEKPLHYLQTIMDASVEMGQLIDDLLAFSRTGRSEISETPVSLDDLVRDALRGLEMATKDRNIVWKIAPLPTVRGDASMLRQVLVNLLGNAVKYSRPRDPAQIEIGLAGEEDGRIILFVRDNGVGFDMNYSHKLFGLFQRLHRADEFEGTGVGLATVRRIIARHGGRVWGEGEPDHGATFYFTLRQDFPTPPKNP